ncbi:PA3611 family quorum-sensing-regulated virulence factor [Atopomonas sediminilitoris]|uniref:PA3611 family quorum-sensing-regulated virulence factor n=1 Tax=Atopomonas sediminilitoris TaxID=2919919 RepID=UPI001F4E10B7|nr:PA3611 family quorum-sensing-regulated virulence factor [Atopomonas sediminilitoris]MCJ8169810.1 quorum-sensing-regulated virulence factor family protein [Atopomonas sediminilitoris]
MRRPLLPVFALSMALAGYGLPATGETLSEYQLNRTLTQVAKRSSEGTPRTINEHLIDQGYAVEGAMLINYLSVTPAHGQEMLNNRDSTRQQLRASVCTNSGFRELLAQGAVLSYRFSEQHSNRPLIEERFIESDCMP